MGRAEAFAVAIKSPESGRPNLAETPGPGASNIQRAIQAHSAPSFSETAKKFWKREPQKASIHAG
jgi:hypothetical protein